MRPVKVNLNTGYITWCRNFMKEQEKSAQLARRALKMSKMYNPVNNDKEIDNILKRYEKSFWG